MKVEKRLIKNLTNVALAGCLVVASAIIGTNCAGFKASESIEGASAQGIVEPEVPVAMMTGEQMLKGMIAATGTEGLGDMDTAEDVAIATEYKERTGSLPSIQDLGSATGPTLIAVTNVAGTICQKAVERDLAFAAGDAEERLFFREFNFAAGVGAQDPEAVRLAFKRLARNAWRRDTTNIEDNAILTFAHEFYSSRGNQADGPVLTKNLAVATCAAVLSSIDALTY